MQGTSIALLKTKCDQRVSATGQQRLICFLSVIGATFNSDGRKVQWKFRESPENEMPRIEVDQRQCPAEIGGGLWDVRVDIKCVRMREGVCDFQIVDVWQKGEEVEENYQVELAKSQDHRAQ